MNGFSFDDFAANSNILPTENPDRFTADMTAVRSLLEADALFSWHCMLNETENVNEIPADSPMRQHEYWADGTDNDPLICDMSCPSQLGAVLDILPADVEFKVLRSPGYDNKEEISVWILPTYKNISEIGLDRLNFLCDSAG